MTLLLIDGGASATKWQIRRHNDHVVAEGTGAPLHGHLFDQAAKEHCNDTIAGLAQTILSFGPVESVVAGISGLDQTTDIADWYRAKLGTFFGATTTLVADDLFFVYLGNSEPGHGLLIYGGTGSIGYHLTETAQIVRTGGYGYLIDDAGSGFWIGQQALRHWLRRMEAGATVETPIDTAMLARFGSRSWSAIRSEVYSGGRSMVASLSKEVCLAAGAGDQSAITILDQAGRELGQLANRLFMATQKSKAELVFIGGLRACGSILETGLHSELDPAITFKGHVLESTAAMYEAVASHDLNGLQALLKQQ